MTGRRKRPTAPGVYRAEGIGGRPESRDAPPMSGACAMLNDHATCQAEGSEAHGGEPCGCACHASGKTYRVTQEEARR